jgi:hypothetical protein
LPSSSSAIFPLHAIVGLHWRRDHLLLGWRHARGVLGCLLGLLGDSLLGHAAHHGHLVGELAVLRLVAANLPLCVLVLLLEINVVVVGKLGVGVAAALADDGRAALFALDEPFLFVPDGRGVSVDAECVGECEAAALGEGVGDGVALAGCIWRG